MAELAAGKPVARTEGRRSGNLIWGAGNATPPSHPRRTVNWRRADMHRHLFAVGRGFKLGGMKIGTEPEKGG